MFKNPWKKEEFLLLSLFSQLTPPLFGQNALLYPVYEPGHCVYCHYNIFGHVCRSTTCTTYILRSTIVVVLLTFTGYITIIQFDHSYYSTVVLSINCHKYILVILMFSSLKSKRTLIGLHIVRSRSCNM